MEKKDKVTTTLISSDGHVFAVDEAVFVEFRAIHRLQPAGADAAIPIPQVTGDILARIINYCKIHADHKLNRLLDVDITAWDRDFIDVDEKTLFDLFVASHYLGVKGLFNLLIVSVAEMAKKKKPGDLGNIEQLLNLFNSNLSL